MPMRDETDRRLIAELRRDGRAAVTALAGRLGVSRGTVQARLERLLADGVIRGFTVRLSEAYAPETIRAVMMVEVEGSSTRSVIRALRGMPEIVELHTTNGAWDLVAEISVATLPEFDRLLREVRETPGVLNSETSLLLDTV
jgi:DNA-binding Lrp family transcriptional regulator